VLHWGLLGPRFRTLEGLEAFDPVVDASTGFVTSLVAARYSGDDSYHYFLTEPVSDALDTRTTYYASQTSGEVTEIDSVTPKE
ncbi:unnamed protein product, partial [Choristocarpus tenellus]